MSWAARFAGLYFLLASVGITGAIFGQLRPSVAWPVVVPCVFGARGAMRVVRLETAGRYRP